MFIIDNLQPIHDSIFYSQDIIEKVEYIPLDTWVPYREYVLYSTKVENLQENDLLSITTEFEVTNNTGINLMIASSVKLCDSATSVKGNILISANGFNVSPSMHHGVMTHARQIKLNKDYGDKYVNVIIVAASTDAKPIHRLKIEKEYGHLDIMVFKNKNQD